MHLSSSVTDLKCENPFTKVLLFFSLNNSYAYSLSSVQLPVTLWTAAHQAPLSIGFFGQEYWSGLLFPPPGDIPQPGIEPMSLVFPAFLASGFHNLVIEFQAYNFIFKLIVFGVGVQWNFICRFFSFFSLIGCILFF